MQLFSLYTWTQINGDQFNRVYLKRKRLICFVSVYHALDTHTPTTHNTQHTMIMRTCTVDREKFVALLKEGENKKYNGTRVRDYIH